MNVFDETYAAFVARLNTDKHKKKQLEFFKNVVSYSQNVSTDQLQESVRQVLDRPSSVKLRRIYSKFRPVVEALDDYSKVLGVFVQAKPIPLSIIWGGLKIVVECAGRYDSNVDKISRELERLPDLLFCLSSCEETYEEGIYGADVARSILGDSYIALFEFWYYATKVLKSQVLSSLVESRDLTRAISDLSGHWDRLSKVCEGIESHLNKSMRQIIHEDSELNSDIRKELKKEFLKLAIERSAAEVERKAAEDERQAASRERVEAADARKAAEEEAKAQNQYRVSEMEWKEIQEKERLDSKLLHFRDCLNVENYLNFSTREDKISQLAPGTCEWILEHPTFKMWEAPGCTSPVLWLHGRHGAGKSFICAALTERILRQNSDCAVAFQFMTDDKDWPRINLLRALAAQLLTALIENPGTRNLDKIHDLVSINQGDVTKMEQLVHELLSASSLTYIFVDGLDEVDYLTGGLNSTSRQEPDVLSFAKFLIQEAVDRPERVRLWFSSQPSPRIEDCLRGPEWKHAVAQLPLTTEDTAHDILSYLKSKIEGPTTEIDSLMRALVALAVSTEVEGSFLWASMMLSTLDDQSPDTENMDDLFDIVKRGLPQRMEDLYDRTIGIIEAQPGHKNHKHLPLWRIVLSLLAFAKRPMRVVEIAEAVAILRTPAGEDLDYGKLVTSPDKIVNSCMRLVRHIRAKSGPEDDLLRLSHSSVRTYLIENADISNPSRQTPIVERGIIRDCSLRYLSQPRYARLLQRASNGSFYTQSGSPVSRHHLLSYAAKYWYQHCDLSSSESGPATSKSDGSFTNPETNPDDVKNFLRSSNFPTCIQVQSVFVEGHFLLRFDAITDRGLATRRTLPDWLIADETHLSDSYIKFQTEWCQLLQLSLTSGYIGQVDRCFWESLGETNFLSQHKSRYANFLLGSVDKPKNAVDCCKKLHLGENGTTAIFTWVRTVKNSRSLHLEKWSIAAVPMIIAQMTWSLSSEVANIDQHPVETLEPYPLCPDLKCIPPPDMTQLSVDSKLLRAGRKVFFHHKPSPSLVDFEELKIPSSAGSWEDACCRQNFVVLCRRRVPRERVKSQQEQRQDCMREEEARRERLVFQDSTSFDMTLPNLSSDSDEAESVLSLSSPEYSCTEGSICSDRSSEDIISNDDSQSTGPESDSKIESSSISGGSNDGSLDEGNSSTPSDVGNSNDESVHSHDLQSDESDSDDLCSSVAASHDDTDSEESDDNSPFSRDVIIDDLEESQKVEIAKRQGNILCDSCDSPQARYWFHCITCSKNDFDLCQHCIRRGRWCFNLGHTLYRMVDKKAVGAVSRKNFRACQELAVYDKNSGPRLKPLFYLRKRFSSLLYESPPVIHLHYPLVVWPLNGTLLLFADFERKSFFEQKLKSTTETKVHQVCVNLSFSPCGLYLRVCAVDVAHTASSHSPSKDSSSSSTQESLLLHVMILKLSSTTPTRSTPTLVSGVSVNLGLPAKSPVSAFPFAFTWTATHLYVTISSSRLRLYRITLQAQSSMPSRNEGQSGGQNRLTQLQVRVPKEAMFLPRSASNRSVQYFPSSDETGISRIIIGPRHGSDPEPAIGVLLHNKDLGPWVAPRGDGKATAAVEPSGKRLEGQFEVFDEENDCDIITLGRKI